MAKIPYFFETPIPKYFREQGWFENENVFKFVNWAFSKCSTESKKVIIQGKEITLQPFEFIAGRCSSPQECYMTEKQWRSIAERMQKQGLLKKTANSKANKYSCYVWVVDRFTKEVEIKKGQQMGQQMANKITRENDTKKADKGPTKGHKLEYKNIRNKNKSSPTPSKKSEPEKESVRMTGDFSSKIKKIEVVPGVSMTQVHLDECIRIKGSIEKVREAVSYIQTHPKRKRPIFNWPNALQKWSIPDTPDFSPEQRTIFASQLFEEFDDFSRGGGWRCRPYHDDPKNQDGILFESQSPYQKPFFISINDSTLKEKCDNFIKEKNIRIG